MDEKRLTRLQSGQHGDIRVDGTGRFGKGHGLFEGEVRRFAEQLGHGEPTTSRASRMATASTPKTTVVVIGEKCHFRW
ncbi:hypothetical protein ACFFWE_08940 [Sphaerisporangium melleum]|uniref:hypothetical protein n=1 Tax=Sphaerisporangium melleum TaxID=321316 RepID=UPI00166B4DC9|nr:hypothetical protein [Sphaerisporangium melleum]